MSDASMPEGWRLYSNDWLVQVWRPATPAERAAGSPQPKLFSAYFADPPGGPAPDRYTSREAAVAAMMFNASA